MELQDKKQVQSVKAGTMNNAADILTKCSARPTYEHLLSIPILETQAFLAGGKQQDLPS